MLITVIVKVSKFCNLRCVYCYETPELANQQRMSHEDIGSMFLHLREFIEKRGKDAKQNAINFIWHGGEPFVQPVDYWQKIFQLQDEILGGDGLQLINTVQTNLTQVREKHLPLLRKFRVGFSFDVLNDYRVDMAGRPTAKKIRKQIDWLLAQGIQPGGIAVVSKKNVNHPQEVAEFFLQKGIPFRALHIYQAKDMLPQIRDAAVSSEEYLQFCKNLYELPIVQKALDDKMNLEPLAAARDMLSKWQTGAVIPLTEAQCWEKEWAVMVNTNGDVYSPGDCYKEEFRYGNIFHKNLDQLLYVSEGRTRRIRKSRERLENVCKPCFLYRKSCWGTYVSHATAEEYREQERLGGCYHKLLAEMMRDNKKVRCVPAEKQLREVLYLNITYRCNSRCLFCAADVAYKKEPRQLTAADVQRLAGDKKYLQVQLSGGEPTIHPEILEIIRVSRRHSEHVALLTHGRTFQTREFAEKVLQAGVNSIIIPLYGPDAATHDHVSKVKGSFDQTVKGFEYLQELQSKYRVTVELKFLLTRYTTPLNADIYRFAKGRFPGAFQQVSICPLIYSQSTIDFKDEFAAKFSEMKNELFSLIRLISNDRKYRLRLNEIPPCFFPEELRPIAHPFLNRPVVSHTRLYGDDRSPELIAMDKEANNFRTTLKGNQLVESCKTCVYQSYCAERETPYFSAAYLEQFGEQEFHPITQQSAANLIVAWT